MFRRLQDTFQKDKDLPDRAWRLTIRKAVLEGTLYDGLKHAFHDEKDDGNGEYIPMRDRRPSVRSGLCRLVVQDSVALLFSEGHFPEIDCGDDEQARETLADVLKEAHINQIMVDAAIRGSVGSSAIQFQVLGGRVFFKVLETTFLTPTWKQDAPDTLEKVTEKYKVKGRDLLTAGYPVKRDDLSADFWFMREWDSDAETWFTPWKVADKKAGPIKDTDKSVAHALGFVPICWVKNLPGGDSIDGGCTFPNEAIDTAIEVDYLLSQGGRALKYASDPTLLLKEPATSDNPVVRSASNALVVDKDGDAKLLEIDGTASAAVMDYVRMLREIALETMHGNRTNADKVSAAQSGRALELMHLPLIWLADQLRVSYGEGALRSLLSMIVMASNKIALTLKDGSSIDPIKIESVVGLRWPQWFKATPDELLNRATTLTKLCDGGLLSRQTAIKILAADFDIEDTQAEQAMADADMAIRNEAAQKQVKINE